MTKLFPDEEFKKIHFNENYLISNYGRLYNSKRKRFISGRIDKYGYRYVTISGKNYKIHRLVALYFLKTSGENLETVNHKDCNKLNNHVSNLEFMSFAANTKTAWKDNLHDDIFKKSKYTKEQIVSICEYLTKCNDNEKLTDIAKKFNVSRNLVQYIYNKKRFKNIADQYTFVKLKSVRRVK